MLKCNSCIEEEKRQIREMTYYRNQFDGPFLDFTQIEYNEYIQIKLGRAYAEDSKYANLTRLQMTVKLLKDVSEEQPQKKIYLKIWGKSVTIPSNSDEFEIFEILIDFIIKNAEL